MRFSRVLLIATFAVAVLLLPSLASADGITWALENVSLSDSGSITGTFNYDATTNSYSVIDLTSVSSLGDTLFTTLTPAYFSTSTLLGVGPATIPGGDYAGLTFLQIFFTYPLTNSGGTDSVRAVETYCANSDCSTKTVLTSTSGMVTGVPISAPEPASVLLLAAGLMVLLFLRRQA